MCAPCSSFYKHCAYRPAAETPLPSEDHDLGLESDKCSLPMAQEEEASVLKVSMQMQLPTDIWIAIGTHCCSCCDLWALTASCRSAHTARSTALLLAAWLMHHQPDRAILVAIKLLHNTPQKAVAVVQHLLLIGACPNACSTHPADRGWGALHWAAECMYLPVVQTLLSCTTITRCNPSLPDVQGSGHTPLHVAASRGDLPILHALSHAGVNANARRALGATPLHWAARYGEEAAARALLAAGADADAADVLGLTPMHLAAVLGHAGVVQVLVTGGASLTARTPAGRTALHGTCISGCSVHVVQLLMLHSKELAEVRDEQGLLPADWAQQLGHMHLVHSVQAWGMCQSLHRGRHMSSLQA